MAVYIEDEGDYYDKEKWDFDESDIPIYWIDKYPYKARNKRNAIKLANLRKKIDKLCFNIFLNGMKWKNSTTNSSYLNGVGIFLDLHMETIHNPNKLPHPFYHIALQGIPTSKYLLSEMPEGTKFDGLCKPKMRYIDKKLPHVGKDGNGRALYRDIFLNLNKTNEKLTKLIIHELAHSMANHIRYRPNDHHADFEWAENFITTYWP